MTDKLQAQRPDSVTAKNLIRLPHYLARGVAYHAAGRFHTPKPLYVTFRVTGRCNSRCIMCSVWENQGNTVDLTIDEIGSIFGNRLFNSAEKFVFAGGEPTLREDLAQIADLVLGISPGIQEMVVITNGLAPDLVVQRVRELQALPRFKKLPRFAVSVSLDGYGETHERIRRVPDAFRRVKETIARLQDLQRSSPFYLCSTCVVQPSNVSELMQLWEFGTEKELPIIFSPVCVSDTFVQDAGSREALMLKDGHMDEVRHLLRSQMESGLKPSNLPFWREYFSIVNGGKRKLPCHLPHYAANLDSDGTLFLCSADSSLVYGSALDTPPDELWYSRQAKELRRKVKKDYCPTCTISCDMAFCFGHEFFYYANFLLKEKGRKLLGK